MRATYKNNYELQKKHEIKQMCYLWFSYITFHTDIALHVCNLKCWCLIISAGVRVVYFMDKHNIIRVMLQSILSHRETPNMLWFCISKSYDILNNTDINQL